MQDLENKRIFSEHIYYSLATFKQMVDDSYLTIEQSFQREYFYDNMQASSVVEYVLLGFPLVKIYLSDDIDGFSLIDGKQRILSLMRFINNEFPLSGLEILNELNGKYFNDLDDSLQKRYENSEVSTVVIKKASPEQKSNIFLRINQSFH